MKMNFDLPILFHDRDIIVVNKRLGFWFTAPS